MGHAGPQRCPPLVLSPNLRLAQLLDRSAWVKVVSRGPDTAARLVMSHPTGLAKVVLDHVGVCRTQTHVVHVQCSQIPPLPAEVTVVEMLSGEPSLLGSTPTQRMPCFGSLPREAYYTVKGAESVHSGRKGPE